MSDVKRENLEAYFERLEKLSTEELDQEAQKCVLSEQRSVACVIEGRGGSRDQEPPEEPRGGPRTGFGPHPREERPATKARAAQGKGAKAEGGWEHRSGERPSG